MKREPYVKKVCLKSGVCFSLEKLSYKHSGFYSDINDVWEYRKHPQGDNYECVIFYKKDIEYIIKEKKYEK